MRHSASRLQSKGTPAAPQDEPGYESYAQGDGDTADDCERDRRCQCESALVTFAGRVIPDRPRVEKDAAERNDERDERRHGDLEDGMPSSH